MRAQLLQVDPLPAALQGAHIRQVHMPNVRRFLQETRQRPSVRTQAPQKYSLQWQHWAPPSPQAHSLPSQQKDLPHLQVMKRPCSLHSATPHVQQEATTPLAHLRHIDVWHVSQYTHPSLQYSQKLPPQASHVTPTSCSTHTRTLHALQEANSPLEQARQSSSAHMEQ